MSNTDTKNKNIEKKIDKFRKSGKLQLAIDVCKSAISEDENNAQLHIKLGDLYMEKHLDIRQAKRYVDEAITEYQRALESSVDTTGLYYKIATAFYYKRELDKAENYYKTEIEHNPKSAESQFMLARILMNKGQFAEAKEAAEEAIKMAPRSSSRAYFLLYWLLKLSDKPAFWEKFSKLMMSALTLPFDKYAQKAVGRYLSYLRFMPRLLNAARIIYFKGFNEQVLDIYRKIIDEAPGYTDLYISLGRIYSELKRYDDAICEYKMAVWMDSINVKAYYYLCLLYEEQKDFENAAMTCAKLIELQPHVADFQCRLAQYLYLAGETDAAVEHYQTALTLSKNKQWAGVVAQTLGFIFRDNIKNLDAAISAYQHAYSLAPDDIDIYLNLGNVFFEKGSYDNAVTVYKRALENSPHNARLHCNLGYLYWGKGETEEAVKEYEKAIKYDKTYDIAYNNLGVIYLDDLGLVKKAIELFELARKYNPNYALANYNLARSIAITGDKVEAAKLYKLAADINNFTQELDPEEIDEKIRSLFE